MCIGHNGWQLSAYHVHCGASHRLAALHWGTRSDIFGQVLSGYHRKHVCSDRRTRVLRPAHAPVLPCRLAVLEACSGNPLTYLELEGAVPLSWAVAEAVAACCPNLSILTLDYRKLSRPSAVVPAREAASKYHFGCAQLLTLCGPRLRTLNLLGVHHWKALSFMALRRCTALTGLALDAGVEGNTCGCEQYLGGCMHVLVVPETCVARLERGVALACGQYPGLRLIPCC